MAPNFTRLAKILTNLKKWMTWAVSTRDMLCVPTISRGKTAGPSWGAEGWLRVWNRGIGRWLLAARLHPCHPSPGVGLLLTTCKYCLWCFWLPRYCFLLIYLFCLLCFHTPPFPYYEVSVLLLHTSQSFSFVISRVWKHLLFCFAIFVLNRFFLTFFQITMFVFL